MSYLRLLLFFLFSINSLEIADSKSKQSDHKLAKEYHRMGIESAMREDYITSLAYLRTACRLKPNDLLFLNDLGVTEMRVGDYQKAKKRFVQVLEQDNTHHLANDNLNELKRFMSPTDYNRDSDIISRPQRHSLLEMNELSPYHTAFQNSHLFSDPLFSKKFEILREPFIVRNAAEFWGWMLEQSSSNNINTCIVTSSPSPSSSSDTKDHNAGSVFSNSSSQPSITSCVSPKGFSMKSVLENYGSNLVDYYPQNMNLENVQPFRSPLSTAYNTISNPQELFRHVDISEPGTYIQWNIGPTIWNDLLLNMNGTLPNIFDNDDYWMNQCFNSDEDSINDYHIKTHWKMMLIGEQNSGMFNHKDTLQTASFQIQLVGHKKWHLCAPSQDLYLYNAGDVNMFQPDYNSFPKALNATCYQVITEPGDVIYYPKNYWHQTLNLDTPTISLTGTLVTPHNYLSITHMIQRECDGKGNTFIPTEMFCKQLVKCFDVWKRDFN